MGRCRKRAGAALALLATVLPGCVTGHLLDAARRRERPLAITAAALDGERLLVRYTADVTGDTGTPHGTVDGAAGLPLATLRTRTTPAADAVTPVWVTPARVARGQAVPLVRGAPGASGACTGPALEVVHADGRDTALVWHDGGGPPWAPVPAAALTRLRTAAWAWPLVPATLAADAVVVPVLLIFAPAVLVVGE